MYHKEIFKFLPHIPVHRRLIKECYRCNSPRNYNIIIMCVCKVLQHYKIITIWQINWIYLNNVPKLEWEYHLAKRQCRSISLKTGCQFWQNQSSYWDWNSTVLGNATTHKIPLFVGMSYSLKWSTPVISDWIM